MIRADISTKFGQISFEFEDETGLLAALDQLPDQVSQIESKTIQYLPRSMRDPKPGFESAYRFTPKGQVELLHFPSENVRCVALALFAYHPEMVIAEEIELVSGIAQVSGKVLNQTANKKYFRKRDDLFGLSADGIAYVNKTVVASLPQIESSEEVPES